MKVEFGLIKSEKFKKLLDKINNIAYNIEYALGINDIFLLGKQRRLQNGIISRNPRKTSGTTKSLNW
jgi:hypothetical protein